MKKLTASILSAMLMLSMVFSSSVFAANDATQASALDSILGLFTKATTTATTANVQYRGHVQDYGDVPANGTWVQEDNQLGTTGESKRIEGFKIELTDGNTLPAGTQIRYNVHVENEGWLHNKSDIVNTGSWEKDGAFAGSVAKSQRVEAIEIVLTDANGVKLEGYSVQYMVHVENLGWSQGWVADGAIAGTEGRSFRLEAIRIKITQVKADLTAYNAALAKVAQADYTTASWTTYQGVVNANKVTDANTQTQVNTATANITAAQANLVLVPKVTSVTAINAKQIQVVYNVPVDSTLAKDVANYSVKKAGATAVTLTATAAQNATATSELSADAKTVTITLDKALNANPNVFGANAALVSGDTFQVTVDNIKNAAKTVAIAKTTQTVTYNDTTAPTLVSATAAAKTTTNKITLAFSEPVNTGVATLTVNGTTVSLAPGLKPNEVIATTGTALTAGTTYNLSLLNFKDYAGNLMATNPLTTTVTVSTDVVAPVVTNVSVIRDNLVEVTFDKSMDASTLTTTSIKLLDPNLNAAATMAAPVVKANTDSKTFSVSWTTSPAFNASGSFSGVLAFTNANKDTSGNVMVATNQSITLTKDTTAPAVVSATYVNTTPYNTLTLAHGAIVVKYNEAVTPDAAANAYKVVNNLGAEVTATALGTPVINPNDATELVLPLSADVATGITSYTVIVPVSAVKDNSLLTNASVATTLNVDVSAGTPVPADAIAPVVESVTTNSGIQTKTSGVVLTATITEANTLNTATVTDTNNYRIDGAPLPTGSYVILSGTAPTYTATITIPAGNITKDKTTYAINVNGIADKAGNVMTPFATLGTLYDDVAPTMTSAVLNTNGTISIGFSETMAAATGTEAGFTLKVNDVTWDETAYGLTDGTGSDAGKYVLTAKTRTVGKATDADKKYVDPNGTTYYTVDALDVLSINYVDVDGSATLTAGDIVVSATDTSATTTIADAASATVYSLNNAGSIAITTVGVATDATHLTNILKAGTYISVK